MKGFERVRPAYRNNSGFKPDVAFRNSGRTGKSPSYYIKKALSSKNIKEKERKLLRSLLRAFEGAEREGMFSENNNSNFSLTLADYLFRESEDIFIDFIESVMFSSQASYEAWFEEGFIIENKKEGAKSVFSAIRSNPDRYRLVISMKNTRGSGVVFKDIFTGKTLLPRKWSEVKGLGLGKFYIVRVDNGKVSRVLTRQ